MCEADEIGLSFEELKKQQRFIWRKAFGLEETIAFCRVSGDHNRVHTDSEFAKAQGFPGGAVVHGVRSLAEVSKACGDTFFVPGVVCLNLQAEFRRPVYHEKPYEFKLEVEQLISGRRKEAVLLFYVTGDDTGLPKICIAGKVKLKFPSACYRLLEKQGA
jgi:acyl dehydratase